MKVWATFRGGEWDGECRRLDSTPHVLLVPQAICNGFTDDTVAFQDTFLGRTDYHYHLCPRSQYWGAWGEVIHLVEYECQSSKPTASKSTAPGPGER